MFKKRYGKRALRRNLPGSFPRGNVHLIKPNMVIDVFPNLPSNRQLNMVS